MHWHNWHTWHFPLKVSEMDDAFLRFVSKQYTLLVLHFTKRKKVPSVPTMPCLFLCSRHSPFVHSPLTMESPRQTFNLWGLVSFFERCVLLRGPRKIFNFWGKAEAGVALMSAMRLVCATSLPNASLVILNHS